MRSGNFSPRQLVDLEELISSISRPEERILISEAVDCYYVGAYRAAIIIAWVAAADVLNNRLREIAINDGVAKKRLQIIEEAQKKGNSVERELICSFGSSSDCLNILNKFEEKNLYSVAEWRNDCAHTTGFQPIAEQARTAIRTVVETVMLKPLERGYGYLNELVAQWIQQGRPLTFQKPDKLHIRQLVKELRLNLKPVLFERCLKNYEATTTLYIRQVCLAFAEESLLQLSRTDRLNDALKFLPDFMDSNPFQGLFLLSSLDDINLIQPTLKLKSTTILHGVISSSIQISDEELVIYRELITKRLLTPDDFKLNDLYWFEQVVKQPSPQMLKNIARCFPSELTRVIASLLRPSNHQYGVHDISDLKQKILGLDLLEIVGLSNLERGSWYQELAVTLVDFIDLEEDVNSEDFDATYWSEFIDELKKTRAQNFIRSGPSLPDELLECVLEEAINLFEVIYLSELKRISPVWLDLIEIWVQRGKDFPDNLKQCFRQRSSLFGREEFINKLGSIRRNLHSSGYSSTLELVNSVVSWSIPF